MAGEDRDASGRESDTTEAVRHTTGEDHIRATVF